MSEERERVCVCVWERERERERERESQINMTTRLTQATLCLIITTIWSLLFQFYPKNKAPFTILQSWHFHLANQSFYWAVNSIEGHIINFKINKIELLFKLILNFFKVFEFSLLNMTLLTSKNSQVESQKMLDTL